MDKVFLDGLKLFIACNLRDSHEAGSITFLETTALGHERIYADTVSLNSLRAENTAGDLKKINRSGIEDFIKNEKSAETFSTRLLRLIDKSGRSDSDIYKRAGIDRRHFSKIRSNPDYRPKKTTVFALCMALGLGEHESGGLLSLAGYSFSHRETFDLIIIYCLRNKMYDITSVNEALEYFGEKPFGADE